MSKTKEETREEKLERLVRRFVELLDNMPPFLSACALLDAKEPEWRKLDDVQKQARLNEGHRRLARLMGEAYDAIGGGEP